METLIEPVDIQSLRKRGLRESAPGYKVRDTNAGRRHQQFRYFMWLVCPKYLSSLSDGSVKYLELMLSIDSININQLVSQAEQFVKRHPEGIEVEDKKVPRVKGYPNSKINRNFYEKGSQFIVEYLGIEIPPYSTVANRFYDSIINHCVKSQSQQSVVSIIQETTQGVQTSYEEKLPPVTSKARHRARYFCGLICYEYHSSLPHGDQQTLEGILMKTRSLNEVVQQAEQFVLKYKGNIVVEVEALPIRTVNRTPKADQQYKRKASKFIQNYLGIEIPLLDELSADFYESIIYHRVTSAIPKAMLNSQELIRIS